MGIWSGELRKILFDCSVISTLFFFHFYLSQSVEYQQIDKGSEGRGETEQDWTNSDGNGNAGRYGGQERPTGASFVIF